MHGWAAHMRCSVSRKEKDGPKEKKEKFSVVVVGINKKMESRECEIVTAATTVVDESKRARQ